MPTTLFIILAIVWIVIPIIAKKKQQQAKAAAEQQRAARQRAQQSATQQPAAKQPMRTTPVAPRVAPSRPASHPSFEGVGTRQGNYGPIVEGVAPHDIESRLSQVDSTLKEAKKSITHTVTASSLSGHAHQETSATGIQKECPPDEVLAAQAVQAARAAQAYASGESAFVWNVSDARAGLVMAEVLGPCLAMRD